MNGATMQGLGRSIVAVLLVMLAGCEERVPEPVGRSVAGTETLGGSAGESGVGSPSSAPSDDVDGGDARECGATVMAQTKPTECPRGGPGPAMVEHATPAGARYCIDSTEVTQAQYAVFLEGNVDPKTQCHPLCTPDWNPHFEPLTGVESFACQHGVFDPEKKGNEPVTCVDFCDAIAYCAWAGRRLCGAPGKENVTFGSFKEATSDSNVALNNADKSQWYDACSNGGTRTYPYGATFDADECGRGKQGAAAACAAKDESGTVYGLSGSVQEWEDVCSDEGTCPVRGGARHDVAEGLACDAPVPQRRQMKVGWIGFRCCLDLEGGT